MRSRTIRSVPFVVLLAGLLLFGCTTSTITFVEEGRAHTRESALKLADTYEHESTSMTADDASSARTKALTDLRSKGNDAARAADLITDTFPSDTAGVPFYVEIASYESTPCVVLLESIGRPGQDLTDTRLWVLGNDGEVLLSAIRP